MAGTKKDGGKLYRGTGLALKVSVVQVGEALDRRHEESPRIRRHQKGGGDGDSRPPSTAGTQQGQHSHQQGHQHRSAGGQSTGWWAIAKSTGSPYLRDQRFPLCFGSGHQRHSPRGHQHQHQHPHQHPTGSRTSGSSSSSSNISRCHQAPHPNHSQRLAGGGGSSSSSSTGGKCKVAEGSRCCSSPPLRPGQDGPGDDSLEEEEESSCPRESLYYVERQHSMPALPVSRDCSSSKDGVHGRRRVAVDKSSPRQRVHIEDTDRVIWRRRHSHDSDCRPRPQNRGNRAAAAAAGARRDSDDYYYDDDDDEDSIFSPRRHRDENNNDDRCEDPSQFRRSGANNENRLLSRSYSFDVATPPKRKNGGNLLHFAKCHSDDDDDVTPNRRRSDTTGNRHHGTTTFPDYYHNNNTTKNAERRPGRRQPVTKPSSQFCRASLAMMMMTQGECGPKTPSSRDSNPPTSSLSSSSRGDVSSSGSGGVIIPAAAAADAPNYTPLQKFRQQYLEAQLRLQQYRQIKERLGKQMQRQHNSSSVVTTKTASTTTITTKQPKSILRHCPTSGKSLSPSLQRGVSVYIEKLLLLTDRYPEPRDVVVDAATAARSRGQAPAAAPAAGSSPRESCPPPPAASTRPPKRVTFGSDVIFEVPQSDAGVTSRVLSHVSEC